MSDLARRTRFAGKTWIYAVQAAICGSLGIFSLTLGPLFLFQVWHDANGEPAVDAGIALTIMSVPLLLVCLLAVFNLWARRQPVLCIWREGVEINMIGSSSLDAVPLVPGVLRVAWLVVSLQGFRQQLLFAPWSALRGAQISGPPMARTLTIVGALYQRVRRKSWETELVANQVAFREVAFEARIDEVAETINACCQHPEIRAQLPTSSD